MNENEKKAYLSAEIKIVPLSAADMFESGSDALDNWADDIFSEQHL